MLQKLFAPSVWTDEDETAIARLIHLTAWSLIVLVILSGAALSVVLPQNALRWWAIVGFMGGASLCVLMLNAARRTHWAGGVLCLELWVVITWAAWTEGGLEGPAVTAYLLLILVAALIFGNRLGLLMAVICGLTDLGLGYAASTGILPPPQVNHTPFSLWVIHLLFIGVLTRAQSLATSTIRVALQQARVELAERKQAEVRLEHEHRLLRTVIDNLPDYIYLKDTQHRCLVSNLANARALGMPSPEAVVGKTLRDFYPAAEAERYDQLDQQVMATGQPLHIENHFEDPVTRQTRWTWMTRLPFRANDGMILGTVGISRDITDYKRLELELQDQRYFALQIINAMGQGLTVTDETGRFVLVNPAFARFVGYEPYELLGKNPLDMTVPDDRTVVAQARLARRAGKTTSYENRLQHKSGHSVPVLVTGTPRLKDGHYAGAIAVLADLTELKQAEEHIRQLNLDLERRVVERTAQLEAANKELEAFAFSVSHDLRAPLRGIDGFSRILLDDYASQMEAEGQRYLWRVRENVQRMNQLIEDLLQFSRLSRQPVRKQKVDLAALARAAWDELLPERAERSIEISIAEEMPAGEADPALLQQVLINLLGNALKYSRPRVPARIEVGCRANAEAAIYFVRDNGVGFAPQYADRLFGVFQRLHSQQEFEGTGVGLAIVQRILHRHGGRIWAEAETGQGATFYFTLG